MSLFVGLLLSCFLTALPLYADGIAIELEYGETYSSRFSVTTADKESIKNQIEYLIRSTMERDFSKLPEHVHPQKGLYVDLKGFMDLQSLKKEIFEENSYFSVYFFDTNKLRSQKKTDNVRTVRDLLVLSGGLTLDFHFESASYVEVKMRFKKNKLYESELNNPIFVKEKGVWYIYRLF